MANVGPFQLAALKLKTSDLPKLRKAVNEVIDKRIADILNALADTLQEGVNQHEDALSERTLQDLPAMFDP